MYWLTDEAVDLAMDWLAGHDDGVVTGSGTAASTAPMMGSPSQRITDPFAHLPDQPVANSTNNGNATSTLNAASGGDGGHSLQRSSVKRSIDASNDAVSNKPSAERPEWVFKVGT